jgi:hypothetical protein
MQAVYDLRALMVNQSKNTFSSSEFYSNLLFNEGTSTSMQKPVAENC